MKDVLRFEACAFEGAFSPADRLIAEENGNRNE
jgi:hypothetical protein